MEILLYLALFSGVLGFIVFFLVLQSFAWTSLAASFQAASMPDGYTFRGMDGKIGSATYGGLIVVVADAGLYLKQYGLPALFRKPVLIPWAAFGPSEEKTVLLTSTLYTTVRTPEGKDVPIRFKNIELHGYLLKKLPRQDALPPKVVPPIALPDSET
jgi:hypothetical protein